MPYSDSFPFIPGKNIAGFSRQWGLFFGGPLLKHCGRQQKLTISSWILRVCVCVCVCVCVWVCMCVCGCVGVCVWHFRCSCIQLRRPLWFELHRVQCCGWRSPGRHRCRCCHCCFPTLNWASCEVWEHYDERTEIGFVWRLLSCLLRVPTDPAQWR